MKHRAAAVLAVLLASVLPAAADTYDIDASHTTIGFSIRHLVINNVHGVFKDFSGTVEYDGRNLSSLKAGGTTKVASIDTGIQGRDEHLRGPDFFDVAKYPEITFESSRVEKQGDGYAVVGNFTMHGVSRSARRR